jgi:hypothetical protein
MENSGFKTEALWLTWEIKAEKVAEKGGHKGAVA